MPSIRIINLLHVPVHSLGGLQRTALDVERALRQAGHEVTTLSPSGIPHLHPLLIDRLFGHLHAWREAARLLPKTGIKAPDIVIAHNGAGWGLRGVPVIRLWQNEAGDYADTAYSRLHPNHWKLKWIDCAVERAAAQGCANLAVSQSTARALMRHAGIAMSGIAPGGCIPNGVDMNHFKPLDPAAGDSFRSEHGLPSRPRRLLLFAGRPEPYKGLALLRDWAGRFAADLDLVFAGPDRVPANFTGFANVHAIGRVAYDDLPRLYAAADFYTLPSLHEGCSYSVMEAMACGLPCLLTRAGHVDTIARTNERLAPWIAPILDPHQLTGHLEQWIREPRLACELGRDFREDARTRNSLDIFGAAWIQAVGRFIEGLT